ncbi:MAG TPA: hypothetical protein VM008_12680 [Phycisphaerae bacterium]|nr:hypothetical protein [Phycisphaerae bacterium]
MTMRIIQWVAVLGVMSAMIAGAIGAGAAEGGAAGAGGNVPHTMNAMTKTRVAAILDALQQDGRFDVAESDLVQLFDEVTLTANEQALDAFRDSSYTMRMVHDLRHVYDGNEAPAKRLDLLKYLRANDTLARTLAFLINDDKQAGTAFALLDKLRAKHGDELDKYAQLAAAICLVHDRPFQRRINENVTKSPDPVAIYEYYTTNEKRMLFPIRNVPAELLVFVVDTTSPIEEMKWALGHYAGDNAIGKHFFDIQYDEDSFRKGTEKKVDAAGYSLPNILRYGGVCADQAFFAMELGKAIGVPTTYTTASSAEVGHAWVGFLQAHPGTYGAPATGAWNFDVGRYEEYRGVRGNVEDPQTRREIPDSYVSLLAELIGKGLAERQAAVALTDAALRLANAGEEGGQPMVPATFATPPADALKAPRKTNTETVLALLQAALNQNKAYRPAWFTVAELAQNNKLTLAQKALWSNVLLRMCGEKYPDFALTVLAPMIGTVSDPVEQDKLWRAAATKFTTRADLSAEILMNEAAMWEKQGQTDKAGQIYLLVIDRYCNAGPFVIPALAKAEELLNDKKKVVLLYQQSWAKIQKPEDMAGPFMQQSNWFRVGAIYAAKLQAAGEARMADQVLGTLGVKDTTAGQ